jgi:hypothetical protein
MKHGGIRKPVITSPTRRGCSRKFFCPVEVGKAIPDPESAPLGSCRAVHLKPLLPPCRVTVEIRGLFLSQSRAFLRILRQNAKPLTSGINYY